MHPPVEGLPDPDMAKCLGRVRRRLSIIYRMMGRHKEPWARLVKDQVSECIFEIDHLANERKENKN